MRNCGSLHIFQMPAFLKSTKTDPSAACFVVTGDATPDGVRVVRSVIGAISPLPIVASRELQSCVAKRSRLSRAVDGNCRLLILPLFRGSSRFESLILSHHSRRKVACECDE